MWRGGELSDEESCTTWQKHIRYTSQRVRMLMMTLIQVYIHHRLALAGLLVRIRQDAVTAFPVRERHVDVDQAAQPATTRTQIVRGWNQKKKEIMNEWCFRTRLCTVMLCWAGNTLGE